MFSSTEQWVSSKDNVFLAHGCQFDIYRSPKNADTLSFTVDFDFNGYFCRLIFWESGQGHVEVLDIDTEKTFIDEGFDVKLALRAKIPFQDIFEKLSDK